MVARTLPGGTFTMAEDLTVTRMGYGAMQLAGPGVFGPPPTATRPWPCCARRSSCGITHIDTSDFYGPHVTNQIIKEALHPYPDELHIVTKVGAHARRRGRLAARPLTRAAAPGRARQSRTTSASTHSTSSTCASGGFDSPEPGSIAEPFTALAAAAAGGPDQASRHQHRQRRADRRGTVHRAGRVRAELLQHRPPGRRRPDRLPRRTGHRLRALLPARRLHPAAVRARSTRSPPVSTPRRWPSRWRGCSSAPRTSC